MAFRRTVTPLFLGSFLALKLLTKMGKPFGASLSEADEEQLRHLAIDVTLAAKERPAHSSATFQMQPDLPYLDFESSSQR